MDQQSIVLYMQLKSISAIAIHKYLVDTCDFNAMAHFMIILYYICVRHSSDSDDSHLINEQIEAHDEINEAITAVLAEHPFLLSET
jgi:hypothetical protein